MLSKALLPGVKFIAQYVIAPRTVGAILPSSGRLAEKIADKIHFESASCIVEYGPGTGAFTAEILARRKPGTQLVLIELNKKFHSMLVERFGNEPDVHIVHGSADQIDRILQELAIARVDHIISGLPFTSLQRDLTKAILTLTAELLGAQGTFVLFQYSRRRRSLLSETFRHLAVDRVLANIPPAYVFVCRNGQPSPL